MDWNTVDRLEVTVDGTTNTISFDEQEQETTADGGDTVTETVPLYTWNGTEMDTTSVESMLRRSPHLHENERIGHTERVDAPFTENVI